MKDDLKLSRKIIETVAEAEGVAPTELETPLYNVIDPEALDCLFHRESDGVTMEGTVSFSFHGYEVTVASDSSIEIDRVEH